MTHAPFPHGISHVSNCSGTLWEGESWSEISPQKFLNHNFHPRSQHYEWLQVFPVSHFSTTELYIQSSPWFLTPWISVDQLCSPSRWRSLKPHFWAPVTLRNLSGPISGLDKKMVENHLMSRELTLVTIHQKLFFKNVFSILKPTYNSDGV